MLRIVPAERPAVTGPSFSLNDCQNVAAIIKYGIVHRYIICGHASKLVDKLETFTKIACDSLPSSETRSFDVTVDDLRDAYDYVTTVFERFDPPESVANDEYQRYMLGYVMVDDFSPRGPYNSVRKVKDTLYHFVRYYEPFAFE